MQPAAKKQKKTYVTCKYNDYGKTFDYKNNNLLCIKYIFILQGARKNDKRWLKSELKWTSFLLEKMPIHLKDGSKLLNLTMILLRKSFCFIEN